MPATADNIG